MPTPLEHLRAEIRAELASLKLRQAGLTADIGLSFINPSLARQRSGLISELSVIRRRILALEEALKG